MPAKQIGIKIKSMRPEASWNVSLLTHTPNHLLAGVLARNKPSHKRLLDSISSALAALQARLHVRIRGHSFRLRKTLLLWANNPYRGDEISGLSSTLWFAHSRAELPGGMNFYLASAVVSRMSKVFGKIPGRAMTQSAVVDEINSMSPVGCVGRCVAC